MTELSADELALACADSMYERDVAAKSLDIGIDEVKEGYAVLKMRVRADMLNGHDVCHGGFIFTLADTAFAYACNSRNRVTLAQSCSIDFVKPAIEGDELSATAEERSQKGRTGVYDITVCDQQDEVVALFRGRSYSIKGEVIQN